MSLEFRIAHPNQGIFILFQYTSHCTISILSPAVYDSNISFPRRLFPNEIVYWRVKITSNVMNEEKKNSAKSRKKNLIPFVQRGRRSKIKRWHVGPIEIWAKGPCQNYLPHCQYVWRANIGAFTYIRFPPIYFQYLDFFFFGAHLYCREISKGFYFKR